MTMMSVVNLDIAVSVVLSVVACFSHVISMSIVVAAVPVVVTEVTMMTVMTVVITVTMSGIMMDVSGTTDRRDRRNVFTRVDAITRVFRVVHDFDDFLGDSNFFGGWDLNIDVVSLFNSLIGGVWHKLGDVSSVGVESMTVMAVVSVVSMVSGVGNLGLVNNWSFPGLNSSDEKGSGEEFHLVFTI